MDKAIAKIDAWTALITRSLEVAVYAMEGVADRHAQDLTPNGLRAYWAESGVLVDDTAALATQRMIEGRTDLEASLSDSERAFLDATDARDVFIQSAQESFGALLAHIRVTFAKRLREQIMVHVFQGIKPTVMARDGRRLVFTDMLYLTTRQMLVEWYNQVKMGYIVSLGVKEFTLDPDDGVVYKVSDYPDMSQDVFHPRTSTLVGGPNVST